MKKYYRYIGMVLVVVLLIITVFVVSDNTKTFKIDGIKYAVSLDGEAWSTFPEKGAYDVDIECVGADSYWNYEEWIAELYNVTGNVYCNISFTTGEEKKLNEHIISLSGQTQGTGEVVNENGYRYEGKNPNNYVKFNNELWRIIGVFDENSHGIEGENLTKIIRNESIGAYAWNKSSSNNWVNSSLNKLLNGPYYNYSATDSASIISENCYVAGSTVTGSCDYSVIGIQDEYRSMIKNVTWYLGGNSSASATAEAFFGYERSTSDDNYNSANTSNKTTTGYIGLIYPSDFGYSVLASSCARTTNLDSYNKETCIGNSWLKRASYEWTISQYKTSPYMFYLPSVGTLNMANVGLSASIRPTLYLDSSIYIITGDGSLTDPYIIDM